MPTALDISTVETLGLLDGAFAEFAAGVANDEYAVWLGAGISLGKLPGLEGVPVPMRFCFHQLPEKERPKSGTAKFSKAWKTEEKNELFVEDVVYHWRWQRH